ncbi:MAG TPA: hypothetical protein VI958_05135, partial [Acidobacteriota bacterium]
MGKIFNETAYFKIRKMIRLVLVLMAVLTGLWIAVAWRGQQRLKTEMKNFPTLNPEFYAPKDIHEKEKNMAVWINAGTLTLLLTKDESKVIVDSRTQDYSEWNSETQRKIASLLKRNELSFQIASRAAEANQSTLQLQYRDGWTMRLPDNPRLIEFLRLSKLLTCKWRYEIAKNMVADAVATARLQARLAAMLRHEPLEITMLCGQHAEKDFHEFLHAAVGKIDYQQLLILEAETDLLRKLSVSLSRVFEAEGLAFFKSFAEDPVDDSVWPLADLGWTERRRLLLSHRFNRSGFLADGLNVFHVLSLKAKEPSANGITEIPNPLMIRVIAPNYEHIIRRVQVTDAATLLAVA